MVRFTAKLHQFEKQGEKTGWTYLTVPADIAEQLMPGNRKGFRVKGKLDQYKISGVSLIPMGGGDFIIPINATMRKGTGKRKGAMLEVQLDVDKALYKMNGDFMACLDDEPGAKTFFESLSPSHQRYFSKWIDDAKTEETKTKRISQAVTGLMKKQDYGTMIRSNKKPQ